MKLFPNHFDLIFSSKSFFEIIVGILKFFKLIENLFFRQYDSLIKISKIFLNYIVSFFFDNFLFEINEWNFDIESYLVLFENLYGWFESFWSHMINFCVN
jgi:hypothetical protein